MLPVSGAEQLRTSGAHITRPMISHSGAYSRVLSPAPYSLSVRNRFHKPAARAFGFNSSTIRAGSARSLGYTYASMNWESLCWSSLACGECSKCISGCTPRLLLHRRRLPHLLEVLLDVALQRHRHFVPADLAARLAM